MKFLKYVEDKRYFLILFIIMMSFVTLMMMVSSNKEQLVGNIIYTNLGCIFLASIYIITGYFYHNSFYKQLNELINSDEKEILEAAPQPQNYEQELYMELLKKSIVVIWMILKSFIMRKKNIKTLLCHGFMR